VELLIPALLQKEYVLTFYYFHDIIRLI